MINPMQYSRYPFDPKGVHRDNRVENEPHLLTEKTGYVFQPNHGTFYTDSVVLTHQGEILVKYQDYYFEAMHADAVKETGKDAAALIRVTKPNLSGTFLLTYQVVGGRYSEDHVGSDRMLARLSASETPRLHFSNILGVPEDLGILPRHHLHHYKDLYGFGPFYHAFVEWVNNMKSLSLINNRKFSLKMSVMEETVSRFPRITQEDWAAMVELTTGHSTAIAQIKTEYPTMIEGNRRAIATLKAETEGTLGVHDGLLRGLRQDLDALSADSDRRLDTAEANITTIQQELAIQPEIRLVLSTVEKPYSESAVLKRIGKHGFELTLHPDVRWSNYLTLIDGLTRKIDVDIADQLATLSTETGALTNVTNGLTKDMIAAKKNITQLQNNVSQLQTDLAALSQRHDTFADQTNQQFSSIIRSIAQVSDSQNSGNATLTAAIEANRQAITAQAKRITDEVNALNTSIVDVRSDLSQEMQALNVGVTDALNAEKANTKRVLDEQANLLVSYQREVNSRIAAEATARQEKDATIDAALTELSGRLDQENQTNTTQNERLLAAEQAITKVSVKVTTTTNELTNSIAGLQANVANVVQQLDTITDEIEEVKTELSSHQVENQTEFATIKEKQTNLETTINNLNSDNREAIDELMPYIRQWIAYASRADFVTRFVMSTDGKFKTLDGGSAMSLVGSATSSLVRGVVKVIPNTQTDVVHHACQFDTVETASGTTLTDIFNTTPTWSALTEGVYEVIALTTKDAYFQGYSEFSNIFELYEKIALSNLGEYLFLRCGKDPRVIYALAYFIEKLRYKQTPTSPYTFLFVMNRAGLLHVIPHQHIHTDEIAYHASISWNKTNQALTNYHMEHDILASLTMGGMEDIRYRNTASRVALTNLLKNDELYLRGSLEDWRKDWVFLRKEGNNYYPLHENTLATYLMSSKSGLINTGVFGNLIAIHKHPIRVANNTTDIQLKPLDISYTANKPYAHLKMDIVTFADGVLDQLDTNGAAGGVPYQSLGYQFTDIRGTRPIPSEQDPTSDRYYRQWQRQLSPINNFRQTTMGYLVIDFTASTGLSTTVEVGQFCITTIRDTPEHMPVAYRISAKELLGQVGDDLKSFVRQYITEQSKPIAEGGSQWDLSQFKEQPGAEDWSDIRVGANDELIANGVILQTIGTGESSVVFAPTETITVTASQSWRIPPQYVGRKARIVIQAQSLTTSTGAVVHSSARERYLLIPETGAMRLTVGPMTSFGDIFSVNNQQEYDDAIVKRTPSVGNYVAPGMITIHV